MPRGVRVPASSDPNFSTLPRSEPERGRRGSPESRRDSVVTESGWQAKSYLYPTKCAGPEGGFNRQSRYPHQAA